MAFDLSIYNPEQKKAITHEKGAILIVAGAGTGKTHVITGRILHLILTKKVKPENILAVTFTEKASLEMQERITRELPLSTGEIWIKTFHGLCDAILRERGHEIGLSTDYKLLTEVSQWMLVKKNLFKFNLDYYRPLGNPQKFIGSLLSHFSRLKDEDILPSRYIEYSDTISRKAKTDEEKENAKKTMEVAKAYETYEKLLIEENALDYGGLITWTLRLLEKRKSILKEYQDRSQYLLVDEYQDTNYSQNKLLTLLASKNQNLFAVADDDQSIYRWRGSSVTNIMNFYRNFPNAKKIVLSKNYRSKQNILSAAYQVIQENNPYRLEVELKIPKLLKATQKGTGHIEISHSTHVSNEVKFVIDTIENLASEGKYDCAILVRANSHAKPFTEELKKRRIPYQHLAEENLFTQPVIKDLVSLSRFLADPQDDISLFRVLSLPVWGFSMDFLLGLNKQAKRSHKSLYEVFKEQGNGENHELFPQHPKMVKELQELLESLLMLSREHTISYLINIFLESPYGKSLTSEEGFTRGDPLQKLADFSSMVTEYENNRPQSRVQEFVDYISLLEQGGNSRGYEVEIDRTVPKILTLHSAKGLEFENVFLVNLVKDRFPSTQRKEAIEIPEELIPEKLPQEDLHLQEERRLFYVGMTRAKENLYLTYSDFYDGKKKWKESVFVEQVEMFLKKNTKGQKKIKETVSRKEAEISIPREHRGLSKPTRVPLSTLSYSQLDVFKTCPLKYQFKYLLSLPSLPAPALNFGISLHNVLRDFYKFLKTQTRGDSFKISSLAQEQYRGKLHEILEKQWIPYGYDTREHEEKSKQAAVKMINRYFDDQDEIWPVPAYIEHFFKLPIGNVKFEGRIDRIDKLLDGTYEVIDYKTGSSNKKDNIDKDLQLSLYALACRDSLKIPVSKLTLYFLEEGLKVSTTRTDVQLEQVKKELLETVSELNQSDFSATPGYYCGFCDYRGICNYAMIAVQK